MKPRLNVHIAHDLSERIEIASKRPGVTKAAVVEAALLGFFSREFDDQRDGALIRRLDRMTRQYDRLERNLSITTETLALYVRFFLTVTPPLPNMEQEAARALGKERFEYFITQLARRLAGGKNMIRDVLEEVGGEESAFFTEAELAALRAVREGAAPNGRDRYRTDPGGGDGDDDEELTRGRPGGEDLNDEDPVREYQSGEDGDGEAADD